MSVLFDLFLMMIGTSFTFGAGFILAKIIEIQKNKTTRKKLRSNLKSSCSIFLKTNKNPNFLATPNVTHIHFPEISEITMSGKSHYFTKEQLINISSIILAINTINNISDIFLKRMFDEKIDVSSEGFLTLAQIQNYAYTTIITSNQKLSEIL